MVSITHTFVSPVADQHNAGEVGPDEWNALHTISGNFDLPISQFATTTPLDTKALYDTTTTGGFFSTFDCKGANKIVLSQAENQSGVAGGGFRDLEFIQHQDNDTVDYTAIGQKVSFAIRGYVTGKANGSTYAAQFKDFVAGDFAAIGSQAWSARGVTGVSGTAIQYNVGIADNEFAATQPAAATAQSISMAALQAIISSKFAASDGTHKARGVLATNLGKSVTAAFEGISAGTDGDNGQYEYLLRGDLATVNLGAIIMPLSASGNVGTRIVYDTNDFTEYVRSTNSWTWAIASATVLTLSGTLLQTTMPVAIGDANFALSLNTATPFLQFDAGQDRIQFDRGSNVYSIQIAGVNKLFVTGTIVAPGTDNAISLGQSGGAWTNLWLGGGGKIDFGNGDVIIQEAANNLAFQGATAYTYDSPITVTFAAGGGLLGLMGNAGTDRYYTFYTTGFHPRWTMGENSVAESGANAGSDFFIARWSDADGFIDSPLSVGRASGNVSVANTLVASALVSTGSILSTAALSGIGYTTGAGGTVTQATSKSTGVTLSKVTGQIIMNGAALAGDTTVSFTLTNTAIAATDIIAIWHVSGGTVGSYTVTATPAAASATVVVRNITTGSLSEAIVLAFAVVKAVTA